MNNTELMNRVRAPELVTQREIALKEIALAWDACDRARDANKLMLGGTRVLFRQETFGAISDYRAKEELLETYRQQLDRQIWRYLLEATELGPLMGSKQRQQFERELAQSVPAATLENIVATFAEMMGRADEIFAATVISLFERLRPRFKSNEGFGFGERLIFEGAINYMGFNSHIESTMMDLSTVLCVLDGKPRPTRSTGIFALVRQAYESDARFNPKPGEVSTEYVRVKWYKNRNAHVWLLREDLRERMNQILRAYQPDGLCAR